MLMRGMSKNEALQYVGWTPRDGSIPTFTLPKYALAQHPTHQAPPESWQSTGRAFVAWCEDNLWGEVGKHARDYLHGRGLTDETIKAAHIGYNPITRLMSDKWRVGCGYVLAKGIVIPWFIGSELWRITIRDESVQKGEQGRYKQVKGGSNGLYFADTLIFDRPVILVEGEFDALSIAQVCGHSVSVCATGTTQGSRTTRWISALAQKDLVLIAFDAEYGKGDKSAEWWLEQIEHASRLRPLWEDANQMLQDGIDLWHGWILPRLTAIREEMSVISQPAPMQANQEDTKRVPDSEVDQGEYVDPLNFCSVCGALVDEILEIAGQPVAYCAEHLPSV